MMDAKTHEEDAGKYGIEPEEGREVTDGQLEGVAGGTHFSTRPCPNCGEKTVNMEGHDLICFSCGWGASSWPTP